MVHRPYPVNAQPDRLGKSKVISRQVLPAMPNWTTTFVPSPASCATFLKVYPPGALAFTVDWAHDKPLPCLAIADSSTNKRKKTLGG